MNSWLVLGIMFVIFLGIFTLFGKFAAKLRGTTNISGKKDPE